jgi:hypothetical protein
LPGRQFPDKAIDLIDEACTTANLRKQKEVKNVKGSPINTPKEIIIDPGHVAQVNLRSFLLYLLEIQVESLPKSHFQIIL